jgi:hypothetical protein
MRITLNNSGILSILAHCSLPEYILHSHTWPTQLCPTQATPCTSHRTPLSFLSLQYSVRATSTDPDPILYFHVVTYHATDTLPSLTALVIVLLLC